LNLITAYVLAKIETEKEEEIFRRIRELSEVRKAIATFGVYDLIIEVEFERIEDFDEFLFTKIRSIQGIKETVSMLGAKIIV